MSIGGFFGSFSSNASFIFSFIFSFLLSLPLLSFFNSLLFYYLYYLFLRNHSYTPQKTQQTQK
ncbi:hypothetical protein HPHPP25_0289 [Helicobacter pylori Hp P-25]|nr:hypothetical protein HPHPP25_0289 [Helicobacter pylori Hp P-25]